MWLLCLPTRTKGPVATARTKLQGDTLFENVSLEGVPRQLSAHPYMGCARGCATLPSVSLGVGRVYIGRVPVGSVAVGHLYLIV